MGKKRVTIEELEAILAGDDKDIEEIEIPEPEDYQDGYDACTADVVAWLYKWATGVHSDATLSAAIGWIKRGQHVGAAKEES